MQWDRMDGNVLERLGSMGGAGSGVPKCRPVSCWCTLCEAPKSGPG